MDRRDIKALIDALAASDLTELEFSRDGSTLRLVKGGATAVRAAEVPRIPPAPPAEAALDPPAPARGAPELAAPLFGTVHLRPSPAEDPFVRPGDAVVAGATLCLIEAMKTFIPVPADRDGTVEAVLVEPGEEVEAGRPLFRFR